MEEVVRNRTTFQCDDLSGFVKEHLYRSLPRVVSKNHRRLQPFLTLHCMDITSLIKIAVDSTL